jgi:hypothetical protein
VITHADWLIEKSQVRISGKLCSFSGGLALGWQTILVKNKPYLELPICGVEKVTYSRTSTRGFYSALLINASHKTYSHTRLGLNRGLNPQIGRSLSRFVMPLIYLFTLQKKKNKPMAPTILERGLPICGLRPNHVCEVSRWLFQLRI